MEVAPQFLFKTVPEFIAYAKANPGKISMGSAGNGSSSHMAGELFNGRLGPIWFTCHIAARLLPSPTSVGKCRSSSTTCPSRVPGGSIRTAQRRRTTDMMKEVLTLVEFFAVVVALALAIVGS